MFITTKVWVANYPRRGFAASIEESLRNLRTDYIDLVLLHWPSDATPLEEQIAGLNDAVRAGQVRQIGVSNFNRSLLKRAVELSAAPIATNQVEYHPYLNQQLLIEECRRLGVSVTAYCAMAVGRVFQEPALQQIAGRHGRSVAQVVLRWLLQHEGVIALSRSTSVARARSNVQVFDFELAEIEMTEISRLARSDGRIVDPSGLAPSWDATPTRR